MPAIELLDVGYQLIKEARKVGKDWRIVRLGRRPIVVQNWVLTSFAGLSRHILSYVRHILERLLMTR